MKNPSKYQQAIFDWIQHGSGHAVVEAVAGSGKTTTAVAAMGLIPPSQSIGFFAFNKSIALELSRKAPQHAAVMTLNSLGHRAWGKRAGRVNVDADKTRTIIGRLFNEDEGKRYGNSVKKLVGLCKAYGIVPAGVEGALGLQQDSDDVLEGLVDHFDLDYPDLASDRARYLELTRDVLAAGCGDERTVDFDDQLYMPVIFGASPMRFDWVFVDEAQDLSPIQHALVERALKPGGRLVAIGDSRQAIYGFRGAQADSMSLLAGKLGAVSLQLSICYRCPKAHIAMAQEIVPQIEAAPTAADGEILQLGEKWKPADFGPHDLIICRNSAPLVKAAYRLLSQRVAVRILGRDLGAGLVALIRKLRATTVSQLVSRVNEWADKEINKALLKDPESDVTKIEDRRDTILVFVDIAGAGAKVDEVIGQIESVYADAEQKKGVLTLATVHKSKGLEAHRVFVLNDWLMPSRAAKKEWAQLQESNLRYVAYTRARDTLGFIDIDVQKGAVS